MNDRFLLSLPLFVSLTLTACSSETQKESPPDNNMIVEDNEIAGVPEAANNRAASEAHDNAPTQLDMNSIPPALRGRWGMVKLDCTSTHGDAKGLLEINANRLTFYESRGTLTKVSEIEPTRLRARYSFEGEGQSWQSDVVLEAQDEGQSLVRTDYGAGSAPQTYHYSRCAG